MNRRTFFRRTIGAIATAVIGPRLLPAASSSLAAAGPWTIVSAPYEGLVVDRFDDALRLYARELGRAARLQQEQLAAAVFNNTLTG